MNSSASSCSVLIRTSDILALEDDCARISLEIAEIEQRKVDLEEERAKKIDRLAKIKTLLVELGLAASDNALPQNQTHRQSPIAPKVLHGSGEPVIRRGRKSVWMPEILRLLRSGEFNSMLYGDLREAITGGPLGEEFHKSEKGFYSAVAKMIHRGEVVKRGGRLFTAEGVSAFEEALKRGEQTEDFVNDERQSPMGDAIIEFVSRAKGGVSARDIIQAMIRDPRFREAVSRNASSAYNVIARLIKRQKLAKWEGIYFLPKEIGPPRELELEAPKESP
jgi:hypothetical protein